MRKSGHGRTDGPSARENRRGISGGAAALECVGLARSGLPLLCGGRGIGVSDVSPDAGILLCPARRLPLPRVRMSPTPTRADRRTCDRRPTVLTTKGKVGLSRHGYPRRYRNAARVCNGPRRRAAGGGVDAAVVGAFGRRADRVIGG